MRLATEEAKSTEILYNSHSDGSENALTPKNDIQQFWIWDSNACEYWNPWLKWHCDAVFHTMFLPFLLLSDRCAYSPLGDLFPLHSTHMICTFHDHTACMPNHCRFVTLHGLAAALVQVPDMWCWCLCSRWIYVTSSSLRDVFFGLCHGFCRHQTCTQDHLYFNQQVSWDQCLVSQTDGILNVYLWSYSMVPVCWSSVWL